MLRSFSATVIFVLVLFCNQAMADVLVSSSLLATENAVVTDDGRYFVAGESGIQEVKVSGDPSSDCELDSAQGLTVCTLVDDNLDGEDCFFSGMTTDGTYLYAACVVMADGLLKSMLSPPLTAALFRVLPGENGADEIIIKYMDDPVWYNGMTMLDGNTILLSRSQSGSIVNLDGPAIEKLTITSHDTFDYDLSDWLASNMLFTIPNGIQYDGNNVYFATGQCLYRINVQAGEAAGTPIKIYQAPMNKVLDDLAIVGNWLAVAEIGSVNGLGLNSITWVHKLGTLLPWKTPTGLTQLSHLVVDPGLFGTPGSLIGTSYYQGGVYYFSAE